MRLEGCSALDEDGEDGWGRDVEGLCRVFIILLMILEEEEGAARDSAGTTTAGDRSFVDANRLDPFALRFRWVGAVFGTGALLGPIL